ncbi:neurotrophin 1 [Toxorhynchites rutilus septentrionalis]|uniref:neurotrophin 1 n=1 Tax=Toxorhynchites rutilus septentrionalis TaxID=329112 RepID=UPI00247AD312|nr:neurotrophin 1 [Toxorhynchites rutilus septentrionalis]XP_055631977.1 neurotrophin 1 [Toxorhynchites rutilus septentrionalis]
MRFGTFVSGTVLVFLAIGVVKSNVDPPDFDFDGQRADDQDDYYYVSEGEEEQQVQPSHKIPNYNRSAEDTGGDRGGGGGGFLMEDDDTSLNAMEDVDFVENAEESNFQRKKDAMRQIMTRAFANPDMQRKFAEVLPLLKVMTKTQRSTLAALISAQVNSKEGHTMSLAQVKQMFGDRQELVLPLAYDIANMIRVVAKKESLLHDQNPTEEERVSSNQLLRRSFSVRSEPAGFKMKSVRTAVSNLKDDRLIVDLKDDEATPTNRSASGDSGNQQARSMARNEPVSEKLVQYSPRYNVQTTKSRDKSEDRMSYHERKLNMTAFNATKMEKDQLALASDGPIPVTLTKANSSRNRRVTHPPPTAGPEPDLSTPSMEEIEDLALSGLNGTELDAIQANLEHGNGSGPVAEMLISEYRNRPKGANKIHLLLPNEKCDHFTTGVCIRVQNYPTSQIMHSITRHKKAMGALLAEYIDKTNEIDKTAFEPEEIDDSFNTKLTKRSDEPSKTGGSMCPSIIRYARPQKARSATGEWKYIVNTGEHTQTLRLEKCTTPQDSCTYLTDNFRSRCIQIYNYHRLLSWDNARGLHVDIFKVPTCCSCHIDGYREAFPPLNNFNDYEPKSESLEDPSIAASTISKNSQYTTLKFDHDEPENVDENIAYHFANGFQRMKPPRYETGIMVPPGPPHHVSKGRFERPKLAAKKQGPTHFIPSPVLDTYLSPPPNEVNHHAPFKRGPHYSNDNSLKRTAHLHPSRTNRSPIRKQINLNDQHVSETDVRINQVQVMAPAKPERLPPTQATEKLRKRYTTPPAQGQAAKKDKNQNYRVIGQPPSDDSPSATSFVPVTTTTTTTTSTAASTNGHQRINYNYHPIIDFFGEAESTADLSPDQVDRIGLNGVSSLNSWTPVLRSHRPMRIPV